MIRGKYDPSLGTQGDREKLLESLPGWSWLQDAIEEPWHQYTSIGPSPDFSRSGSAALGAGFPLPCAWFEYTGSFGVRSLKIHGGMPLMSALNQPDVAGSLKSPPRYDDFVEAVIPPTLPMRPMWGGLVVNTLLYAVAIGVVWLLLTLVMRLVPQARSLLERPFTIAPDQPVPALFRHGRRIAVCLVFGLGVSVLSAWLLAAAMPSFLLYPRVVVRSSQAMAGRQLAVVNQSSGFGFDQIAFTEARSQWSLRQELDVEDPANLPEWAPWPASLETDQTMLYVGAGWPARSLLCRCVDTDPRWLPAGVAGPATRLPGTSPRWREGIVLAQPTNGGPFSTRVLPLRPIPSGLLVNALCMAAALYFALTAYGGAVIGYRRLRGRCPRCGYDIQPDVSPGCSECGWKRP
jgi:hypothetical protein